MQMQKTEVEAKMFSQTGRTTEAIIIIFNRKMQVTERNKSFVT